MLPESPGIVANTIRHAVTEGSDKIWTGALAEGADSLPKKMGSIAIQSKITVTFAAPEVTIQIPALKA
jgi:hypothetical protein